MAKKKRIKKEPEPPTPTDLVHCTLMACSMVHDNPDKCPKCGNEDSQRPLKFVGVPIYMTIV